MNADTTQTVLPQYAPVPQPKTSPAENRLTDEDFLTQERERTKEAILATLQHMKNDLQVAGDVRLWTKRYPWAVVGLATAAGFVAASAVASPATHQKPEPMATTGSSCRCRENAQPAPVHGSWGKHLGWLREPVMDLLRTAATTFAATSLQAMKTASQSGFASSDTSRDDSSVSDSSAVAQPPADLI